MSDRRMACGSRRLHRECALVGGSIAALLEATGLRRLGPVEEAPAFLRERLTAIEADEGDDDRVEEPLDRLTAAFGLSGTERTLLFLAGLPEEHEGYATILRALHPRGEPRATIGLAAQLLASDARGRDDLRATVESGPLTRSGAVAVSQDGPFFERSLSPMDGLWPALHGLDVWPRSIRPIRAPSDTTGLREWLDDSPAILARIALGSPEPRTVLVTAETEEISLHRATALILEAGMESMPVAAWIGHQPDLEQALTVHAIVRGAIPILALGSTESTSAVPPDLPECPGPIVVAARRGTVRLQGARPVVHVDIERPTAAMRRKAWGEMLPELEDNVDDVASRYTIDPAQIADVARDVRSLDALSPGGLTLEHLAASVRVRSNLGLAGGFRWLRATAEWDSLVLPPDRQDQIREALDRLRFQRRVFDEWRFLEGRPGARGVRMLFSGPPGTGKTLAAEVMAAILGVDLLVVDIPRVVSKWIGETEKNLAEIFEAAERAQAVLFFDEADAFFGRRTEISDAHDRYANFETAYLLSRLERFEGLAILSTNLRQNIDPAFLRRLEFLIEFDEPAAQERAAIWRRHVPDTATLGDDVRIAEFAGLYAIVGGLIRNAAVAAAFLAAGDGTSAITRQHFLHAIAREYEKAGKAFPGVPAKATA